MYKTSAQSLTLDRVLGKSKQNKAVIKATVYADLDKKRAGGVLSQLTSIKSLPRVIRV